MENEFIPYEQAVAIKELGFDEPCFGYYDNIGKLFFNTNGQPVGNDWVWVVPTDAPLYQQAFRWFRKKYDLHVNKTGNNYYTSFSMVEPKIEVLSFVRYTDTENHYEEAELECLKKLIKSIKT